MAVGSSSLAPRQPGEAVVGGEQLHLRDGNLIESQQPVRLRNVLGDEQRVEVLQVGQAHELRGVGLVADCSTASREI